MAARRFHRVGGRWRDQDGRFVSHETVQRSRAAKRAAAERRERLEREHARRVEAAKRAAATRRERAAAKPARKRPSKPAAPTPTPKPQKPVLGPAAAPKPKPAKPAAAPKPKPAKAPPKPKPLSEADAALLGVWPNLSDEQQRALAPTLSDALRAALGAQAVPPAAPPPPAKLPPIVFPKPKPAKPTPTRRELRSELKKLLRSKGAKLAIAREVGDALTEEKRGRYITGKDGKRVHVTSAWAWQGPETALRHPRVTVQSAADATAAANAAHFPERKRAGTRYYSTIVAVTTRPPTTHYGAKPIKGHPGLTAIFYSAPVGESAAEARENAALAIADMQQKLGDAPQYIAAIQVRTIRSRRNF